jgi:hypothetical protein
MRRYASRNVGSGRYRLKFRNASDDISCCIGQQRAEACRYTRCMRSRIAHRAHTD